MWRLPVDARSGERANRGDVASLPPILVEPTSPPPGGGRSGRPTGRAPRLRHADVAEQERRIPDTEAWLGSEPGDPAVDPPIPPPGPAPASGRPRWLMATVALLAVVLVGSVLTAGAREPVPPPEARGSEPRLAPPRTLGAPPGALLPGWLPPGYVVTEARVTPGAFEPLEPTIAVFGIPGLPDPLMGPMVVTGTLNGPISPGPSGTEVGLPHGSIDLGDHTGEVIEDGPITWLSWTERGDEPVTRFVAGRNVHVATLEAIAVDRPELVTPARWQEDEDPELVGPGLELLSRTTFDTVDLVGPATRVLRLAVPDQPDRDLSIAISPDRGQVPALRFLVHEPSSTIRGFVGAAGPLAATALSGRRRAVTWSDGASTAIVIGGPAVDPADLDRVVQELTGADDSRWDALADTWTSLPVGVLLDPLAPSEGESVAVVDGTTGAHRWAVRLRRDDGRLLVDSATASRDGIVPGPFSPDPDFPTLDGSGLRAGVTVRRSPDGPGMTMVTGVAPAGTEKLEVVYKDQHVPVEMQRLGASGDGSEGEVFFAGLVDLPPGRGRPPGHEPEPPWTLVAVDARGRVLDRRTAP